MENDLIPTNKALTPLTNSNRIQVMDLLRGFALIGIIMMNIEWFNRPVSALMSFDYSLTGFDWASSWLVKVFVEGKFYKLFSILFGMGFAIMLVRAQEADRKFGAWFTRRMLALFVFGMAHLIFIWGGDIIHDYAVGGLLLLGFVLLLRTKKLARFNTPATFAKVGFSLLLMPLLVSMFAALYFGVTRDNTVITNDWQQEISINQQLDVLLKQEKDNPKEILLNKNIEVEAESTLIATDSDIKALDELEEVVEEVDEDSMTNEELITYKAQQRFERKQKRAQDEAKETAAFTQTSYIEATKYRAKSAIEALGSTPTFAFFVCLPLFMVGYWLVASGRMKNPQQHQSFFSVMCWGGLSIGLLLSIAGTFISLHPVTKSALEVRAGGQTIFYYGQFVLCAGYIGLFVKLASKAWFIKGFSWLAPLGKMALTNYIGHSIILTTIFYGYAGGMFGQIARGQQMLIVVAVIVAQVVFCTLWLKFFRFGPLEWLWRSITYLKWQPLLLEKKRDTSIAS
ncbi:DUF418 domain-containing protein [Colwellia hornerae]|uniref:DUF418 domain-containing protein n=1 Tax=Colwellia hornerae TaxID=89402 RepID=A0A5C6QJG6_9GAMM|nr:DUF418 domain-containing protein [Colwellia hornerae]TWX58534.1 DUF418 domain-containing protein [Colwellia hornerae]TWX59600.1 DUF418 domain-containing protein [Colwellia hornerae]TWX69326.1 DUF418 domain-containing protein [Colwellia hornerae]